MRLGLIALGAAFLVSGCVMALPGLPQRASERAKVLDGRLTLAAPSGFCVDRKTLQDSPEGAFVLWGNCAAIAADPEAPRPVHRAMLSATIGPLADHPLDGAFEGFEAFVQSDAGRAALARSGRAEDVQVLAVEPSQSLLLLKISDRSAPDAAPVEPVYWRAITGLGGHVSALSVLPLAGSGMDDATQLALLQAFDASIRAAN